jgi:hypothetical protein
MDPITSAALAATLVPLVTGAAGEAGRSAWASLAGFVRSRFGHDSTPVVRVDELERHPRQPGMVDDLAASLVASAGQDPAVDAWLRDWFAQASTISTTSNTINTISGTVNGPAVQAHQIGNVTFGTAP